MKPMSLAKKAIRKYTELPVPVKASLWFMMCSVVQKGISFFTTPIFTRLMTTEQFGQFTLYNSWVPIICIFATLNLQYGSFNTAQIKFSDDRKAYTSSTQGLVTLLCGLMLVLFFLFRNTLSSLLELPVVILLTMVAHVWGQFVVNLWLSNRRFDYNYKAMVAFILPTSVLSQVVSLVCVIGSADKGYARILGMAIIEFLLGIIIYIYNHKQGKKFCVKQYWKFALGFNLPLIPYYLSQIVFSTSDRIMISNLAGTDKAGIYGLGHSIAFLLTFVISAIRNAYTPRFFQKEKENDGQAIHKTNKQLMLLMAAMLFAFIFVAPELLWIMGGQTYYEAIWIIPPLIAGLLFEFFTDFSVNILFYHEKKWVLVLSTIGCAIVNIVLNYFGIQLWGYFVAGYTTLISYILFWFFLDIAGRRVCRQHGMDAPAFLCTKQQFAIGGVFLLLTGLCLIMYLHNYIRYGVFALLLIALLVFHKKVIAAVKSVLSSKQ